MLGVNDTYPVFPLGTENVTLKEEFDDTFQVPPIFLLSEELNDALTVYPQDAEYPLLIVDGSFTDGETVFFLEYAPPFFGFYFTVFQTSTSYLNCVLNSQILFFYLF